MSDSSKVTASHLARRAYLYVRQSTMHQVVEHEEGRLRQYQLRERARRLGWPESQIEVIDCDLGLSGASADRQGFQRLVADVGMGKAGLVMGLEVSRLARNSADWHRLLEICALSEALILDEDGLYDPQQFNDRLLLGLKGTISEAELYMIRARLQGGIRSKARRGELRTPLPIGFVYDNAGRVVLDPDQQVQDAIRLFFGCFGRIGTALGVVRHFQEQALLFPHRATHGKSVSWGSLDFSTAHRLLTNPRYAGIYFFGRTRQRRGPGGRHLITRKPRSEWLAYLPGAHPGYLSVEEFEQNLRQLEENGIRYGADRRRPAREGVALLQGIAVCGRCGRRMTVHYHRRACGSLVPTYVCSSKTGPQCQSVHGAGVDAAIEGLILETVTPLALELALEVHSEVVRRYDEVEHQYGRRVERARYEAQLARERFMAVDPRNRLVALSLEDDWNQSLREIADAEAELDRKRAERPAAMGEERDRALALSRDFPRLWKDPRTQPREKKRLLRLIIEDVTLHRGDFIQAHVRFRGGATHSIELPRPKTFKELRKTSPQVVALIDELLDGHTENEIAKILDQRGLRSGAGETFTASKVANIRRTYSLERRAERLKRRGFMSQQDATKCLEIGLPHLQEWVASGLVKKHVAAGRLAFYDIQAALQSRSEVSRPDEVQYGS